MARVWLIAGPTASGKSALALGLAKAVGGEVVNADSMQLYRDLSVLTARPSAEEAAQAPHHLYGVADAADGWSVGRWLAAATAVLDDIAARGRDAVVVGGTGLYFRALTQGLADIPATDETARDAAGARFDAEGEAAFRAALRELDPAAEARIAPGDRQRLVRAMAVAVATGRPLSQWQAATRPPPWRDWRPLVIEPPRAALYARCDARFAAMVEKGALAEARALLVRRLDPGLPLMKAVGLRELGRHLTGELDLDAAAALAAQETRRYAKRQMTWFRNQTPGWERTEAFGEAVSVEALTRSGGEGSSSPKARALEVRPERAGDAAIIRTVTTAAFATAPHSSGTEARIIDALRDAGALSLSLVAIEAGEVVAHVAFSPVVVGATDGWHGLGPIAVRPDRQGRGIGAALVMEGLRRLRGAGARGCVLVGDPAYYARFGFSGFPDLTYEAVPREYVLGLGFSGARPQGEVRYHEAFHAA